MAFKTQFTINENLFPNARFVGSGKGIKNNQKAFNVRFPELYRYLLAEIPDRKI
ncbi:hypothetical protein IQ270_10785 [Microcoleus sp. LEGE 07076]|uniref:hypothetical protein n=1 Tax=Microcoleus sp. LEGE 07076 TaxID=915322 RepID=UPI00188310BF|nr:hypothetical protein [Microcoleus sp. LEGE 07076]MBE9185188.1 hypothetical protein [Microcoleus sp. LEGE 07076]